MKVFIDCDPGHDDCMMLILALAGIYEGRKMEVLGVTITHGNQTLAKTVQNAERFLNVLTSDGKLPFEIFQGSPWKLGGSSEPDGCAEIHGESGLDGTELWPTAADATRAPVQRATRTLRDALALMQAQSEPFMILATGPLTNIALLFEWDPTLSSKVFKLVLMGGASNGGNTHPRAEFNMQMDPLAASRVFALQNSLKMVVVPLEITHRAIVTPAILQSIQSSGSKFSKLCAELLMFFAASYAEAFPAFAVGPPLHDPLAAFAILAEEQCVFLKAIVTIDETCGETMVRLSQDGHVDWCVHCNFDLFWSTFLSAFNHLNTITFLNK